MTQSGSSGLPDNISPRSSRFRDSVHQIPTPGTEVQRPKRYEPMILNFFFVGTIALLMICMGIVLEVGLYISNARNGFPVSETNLNAINSFLSTHFLTSFLPTLLVAPFAHFLAISDWMLRWYQPYVTLSGGNAPASQSILLDYMALNRLATLYHSLRHQHWLINISTLITLSSMILQPLAGSVLQIMDVSLTEGTSVTSMGTIGLSPSISQLDSFLASAGYSDAAVHYANLQDPPFVHGEWSVAQLTAPAGSILNGTLWVNTIAVQTLVNCIMPTSFETTMISSSNVTLQADFSASCSGSLSLNPNDGTDQFSVTAASTCAPPNQDIDFQPVTFWFYHVTGNGDPEGTAIFCQPSLAIFEVATSVNLNNGSLGDCAMMVPFSSTNNVTGSPLNGQVYNGVVFDSSNNSFINDRAVAISSAIPEAIYRYVSQQTGGLDTAFNDTSGFVNATTQIYTQHLSLAAQSIYFLPENETVSAQLTSMLPRLFVLAPSAHALSALLVFIGLASLILHILHTRARRNLWLTSPPGSIASIVSLTSRSGFGELLLPYDNVERMENKLAGLSFRLDERTGAIVAEEDFVMASSADEKALDDKQVSSVSPLSCTTFKDTKTGSP